MNSLIVTENRNPKDGLFNYLCDLRKIQPNQVKLVRVEYVLHNEINDNITPKTEHSLPVGLHRSAV